MTLIETPVPLSADADDVLLSRLGRAGPMNMAEAVAVMERHGLDALVIGQPVNVFHALGHWPQIARTRLGQPPGTFAILARHAPDRPVLVTSRFLHYYTWADGRERPDVDCWLYDDLADTGDVANAGDFIVCADKGAVALSPLEVERRAASDAARRERAARA